MIHRSPTVCGMSFIAALAHPTHGHLRSAPVLPGRYNAIVLRHIWLCNPA